jgi:hypothetical protein
MVTTPFSDPICNATELRSKQKYWFDLAVKRPVSINYGHHKLTILNRDQMRDLYMQKHYLELAVKTCNSLIKEARSEDFPWIEYLDTQEKQGFFEEFIGAVLTAVSTNDWANLETILDDWKATAETEHDDKAMTALKTKVREKDYIGLK